MADINSLKYSLLSGGYTAELEKVYGSDADSQRSRIASLLGDYEGSFGSAGDIHLFSAPGRTEVGGNHTDHNHGRVLAAAINLDALAAAASNDSGSIRVISKGHAIDPIELDKIKDKPDFEKGTATSLIKGVAAGFVARGYSIGGFDAACVSSVLEGSGLSSSASFEVLIGTVLNHLFNGGKVSAVEIAQIAQFAENEYFGKPCGLMDQTASSVGGFVMIDFRDPAKPVIEKLSFDFSKCGHALCIINTGGNHADLTPEYAAVRGEMEAVAQALDCPVLRETDKPALFGKLEDVREKLGDRAVLRALHFFGDNDRVLREADALKNNDFETFKDEIKASGRSSYMYNQNVYASGETRRQPVALGLALCEEFLGARGAWRVHGGGFAGTIQAFLPLDMLAAFKTNIEGVFGEGSCYVLSIRDAGGVKIL